MGILYKLFKKDKESRDDIITMTSALGIAVNILLSVIKLVIGAMASSMAIISEGINGATDALSSVLALLGAKLAGKHPDEKHPFGYGRIEYITSLVVAGIIVFSGVQVGIESVKLIFHPGEVSISVIALIVVAVSAVIKFFLGVYTIKMGKKAGSGALEGVGAESRSDAYASIITILVAIVFIVTKGKVVLDAYAGVITAAIILKAGIELLVSTLSDIIGRPGKKELADKIYKEIRSTEGVLNAADMMLHDYGPENFSGSCNLELDHNMTVGEIYRFLHKLQLHIMHEYRVTMVFGVYAVDNDGAEINALRKYAAEFVRSHEHITSYHALYIDRENSMIYIDFCVDYKLKDWEAIREEFYRYMGEKYPQYKVELTIETEYV